MYERDTVCICTSKFIHQPYAAYIQVSRIGMFGLDSGGIQIFVRIAIFRCFKDLETLTGL